MLFSGITFLFIFLPLVLLVYFLCPTTWKNGALLFASLVFYAWGEPKYVLVMLASITVGYGMGRLTDFLQKKDNKKGAKAALIVTVTLHLCNLFFFKYIGFFADTLRTVFKFPAVVPKLALPLGISFYTFQVLSYNIDVYRGTVPVQKSAVKLACYITLFPQLIAGPIVRYDTIRAQLDERHTDADGFGEGAKRFIEGLAKKVLIANYAGELFKTLSVLSDSENSVLLTWICSAAFTLQIYFDFSGYSDMAIGLGRMFGFHFSENFSYPYTAKSVTEFWKKWHISLSSWFRDYVYIPLGGNRKGAARQIRNLFVVWLLTGFWHGASWNFVLWGLYYFCMLVLEKFLLGKQLAKLPRLLSHIYALFVVNFGWVLFAYEDFSSLVRAVRAMFGGAGLPFVNGYTLYIVRSYVCFFVIACVAATPLFAKLFDGKRKTGYKPLLDTAVVVWMFAMLVLSTASLASDAFNPFLYFWF